jgi:hypothetical protein
MSQSETDIRTIPVPKDTRDRVRALKRGTETYDDVLHRLMNEAGVDPQIPEWGRD